MRLLTIKAPKGKGRKIADMAMELDISTTQISESTILRKGEAARMVDVVEIETATPKAKALLEQLTSAYFYDPTLYHYNSRHPESLYASELPEKETVPITRPTAEVYEELWQFSQVTVSLVVRVFLSAFLAAYGIREAFMPIIIAGLLFLPYHHNMLGMALSTSLKEWKFFKQSLAAFAVTTLFIVLGGIALALVTDPGIKWTQFTESSIFFSFIISMAVGIAAGLGSVDDAGRRELIGLAATAHISVYPVWFGLKIVYGFEQSDQPWHLLLVFLMDVTTLTAFAAITLKLMKMKGKGIRNFIEGLK